MFKNHVLKPYFFSGLMIYVEKGDSITIAGKEFFINDAWPRCGIIDR